MGVTNLGALYNLFLWGVFLHGSLSVFIDYVLVWSFVGLISLAGLLWKIGTTHQVSLIGGTPQCAANFRGMLNGSLFEYNFCKSVFLLMVVTKLYCTFLRSSGELLHI